MANLLLYSIPGFLTLLLLEVAWTRRLRREGAAGIRGYELRDTVNLATALRQPWFTPERRRLATWVALGRFETRSVTFLHHRAGAPTARA